MKIYLDYVFLVNLLFDFILLMGISIVLKRNTSKTRFILGSVFGGVSSFIILLNISSLSFFILKLISGLLMVVITFSYKNIKYTVNNFIYLIILSILLGGSLYFLNIEASKTAIGTIFLNSRSTYILLLIGISFFIIVFYSKYIKKEKIEAALKYKVNLYTDKEINLIGFLDTGNNLMYKKRPVIILNKDKKINFNDKPIYIPFSTINGSSLMKCHKIDRLFIEKKGYFKNIYVGISNDKFHLKDADIILNTNLWEDNNDKKNN